MKRQLFPIPGLFGSANLGRFTYWGPAERKLGALRKANAHDDSERAVYK
jgi:hypothetical protein